MAESKTSQLVVQRPAGAYLCCTWTGESRADNRDFPQGRFVGRPSILFVVAQKTIKGESALRLQATLLFRKRSTRHLKQ
jgi:hypothetical protein